MMFNKAFAYLFFQRIRIYQKILDILIIVVAEMSPEKSIPIDV